MFGFIITCSKSSAREYSSVLIDQPQRAIVDFDEAIKLDPMYEDAHFGRGAAYGELGQYQQAVNDFGEAIRLEPEDAINYVVRALAYTAMGMDENALNDVDKAAELGLDSERLEALNENIEGIKMER